MSIRRSEPVGVLTEQCGHRMQVDGVWTRCARAAVLCTWHPCSLCPCPPMDGAHTCPTCANVTGPSIFACGVCGRPLKPTTSAPSPTRSEVGE